MIDINQILESAGINRMQSTDAQHEIGGISETRQAMSQANASDIGTIGSSNAIIKAVEDQTALEAQNLRVKRAAELGVDAKAREDILSKLAAETAAADAERAAQLQTITAKKSANPLDNPIGWLVGMLTVNQDIAKYNAADIRYKQAYTRYQDINNMTQQSVATGAAIGEGINQTVISARAQALAAEASLKARQELERGLALRVQDIGTILQLKSQDLAAQISIANLQQSQESFKLAMENAAREREKWDFIKKDKEAKDLGDRRTIEFINKGGRLSMGEKWKDIDPSGVEGLNVIKQLDDKTPLGEVYRKYFFRGQQGIVAASPSEAVGVFVSNEPITITPAQVPVRQLLLDAYKSAQANIKWQGAKPEERRVLIDQEASRILDSQAANVKTGDKSNVFNIPGLKAILENTPELQTTGLYQKLFKERILAGDDLSDPNSVFTAVGQAMREGKITYIDMMDLPLIYQRATALTQAARGLENFGLVPPVGTSRYGYKTKITTDTRSFNFGSEELVDLTDMNQTVRAMNKWMATVQQAESQKAITEAAGGRQNILFPNPAVQAGRLGQAVGEGVRGIKFGPEITYPPKDMPPSIYGR